MRVAVVGAGVIGLSTAIRLLERGADVTVYEAETPMSQRSAGSSRIFRLAHATPELVELAGVARRAFEEWSGLGGVQMLARTGTALTGNEVSDWAAAMLAAGAEHRITDSTEGLDLPVKRVDAPVLIDPNGGPIDAFEVGQFLVGATRSVLTHDTAFRLEPHGRMTRVWSANGRRDFDACLLVAGLGTWQLAAQIELYTPSVLFHHVRFTFRLRELAANPLCLVEKSEAWRPGFTTYQHLAAPGQWAVGAHFEPTESRWELGRDHVVATSRRRTVDYVRENLHGAEDHIVDELYCSVASSWGDGFGALRKGSVLALYGENLFKLAPAIGRLLADAALSGDTPSSTMPPELHKSAVNG